ncbi:MAG: hypothetical protein WC600_01910 [Desulfobaccales bacterium]
MKLSRILAAVLLVGGVLMISSAALALPTPVCLLVGDVDNYGSIPGAGDQVPAGTNIWPGPGASGTGYDGRSAAEAAATNGAQFTDSYSTLFPGFSPADIVSELGSVIIPLPVGFPIIHDGTFAMAMGDFQASTFGAISMNFNGVALDATQLLQGPATWDDGFQASAIRSFVLNPAQLAAINAAGQLEVNFDHTGSADFIAFDWFKLCANVDVPVPPTAILFGSGLLGLVGLHFRKNRG